MSLIFRTYKLILNRNLFGFGCLAWILSQLLHFFHPLGICLDFGEILFQGFDAFSEIQFQKPDLFGYQVDCSELYAQFLWNCFFESQFQHSHQIL